MDPSMAVGIAAGIGLIMYGIGFGNLDAFASFQSAIIVVGGTFAALVASFPSRMLAKVPQQVMIAAKGQMQEPGLFIEQIAYFAEVARRFGLLALEEHAVAQEDEFLKDSLLLIVDAVDSDKARAMLEADLVYLDDRHKEANSFFERGAAFAPAFGMIGTLIGLILMLANLQLDAVDGTTILTHGMAIALITTFYGSLLANLFFIPVSSKLQAKHEREMLCKQIIIEGILSIQAGENPKFIRDKLISFLPYKERLSLK
ncbi:MAG: MotA/TolQ/ExbB proton channel family protein [Clostridiales bacterium]|nr:MotA/TolQ/ExbB proton channel family protein [Clostridiales bacterium]